MASRRKGVVRGGTYRSIKAKVVPASYSLPAKGCQLERCFYLHPEKCLISREVFHSRSITLSAPS